MLDFSDLSDVISVFKNTKSNTEDVEAAKSQLAKLRKDGDFGKALLEAIEKVGTIDENTTMDQLKSKVDSLKAVLNAGKNVYKPENSDKIKQALSGNSAKNDKITWNDIEAKLKEIEAKIEKDDSSLKKQIDKITGENENNGELGGTYKIPIIARTIKEGENSSISLSSSNSFPVETDKRLFAIGTKEGLTTTSVTNPVTARTRFKLEAIGVKENRISSLPKAGSFDIIAPSGYEFVNVGTAELKAEGGISFDEKSGKTNSIQFVNNNRSVIRVTYDNLIKSTSLTGALVIKGLELVAIDNETVTEKDLYMSIKNVNGNNIVTPQTFIAAYSRDWKVNLSTVGTVPTLVNGRLDAVEKDQINDDVHKAVTVKFEEQVANAWWGERVTKFTLPDGVKIRKASFAKVKNVSGAGKEALNQIYFNDKDSRTGYVRVDDNVLTLSGITGSKDAKASFELNLWLSIESGFVGNIELKLSGSGVNTDNRDNVSSVVVAKAVNPVDVKADLTDVKIGYQYFTVGDFTITETAAGRLKYNEDVYISIVDNSYASMQVDPTFKWEVTQGDIKVRNMSTGEQSKLGTLSTNKMNGANISFKVDRASTKASQIKFSNVQVRLDSRYNADTKNKFDLVVWGPAVANNYKGLIDYDKDNNSSNKRINSNDYFYKAGVSVPYINAGNKNGTFKNVVKVKVGNPVILVNDKEVNMPTAAYVSKASNSTMVPVRFISTGLGIDESKIAWDEKTGTVTIDAGNRVIQMTTGSNVIKVNGSDMPMLSPDGLKVTVEVKDDRAFVPFRALGEAFGIPVGWDAATATATYNVQNVNSNK